jgi:hypothetical protein
MRTEWPSTGSGKPASPVRSLPLELWPSADRAAWAAACRPSVRLKCGGSASHMRPVTQKILRKRCGYFFDFLARSKRLDLGADAGAQVTPENVEPYVEELKQRVSSVTVYGSIQKLRRITQLVAPNPDLAWLMEIERELFSEMRPKSKWDRVVLTEIITEAGLTLIAEAETAKKLTQLTRARMVRNGLMQALLAAYPMRIKNFASLEIGRNFVKQGWHVVDIAHRRGNQGETGRRAANRRLHRQRNRQIPANLPTNSRQRQKQHKLSLAGRNGRSH